MILYEIQLYDTSKNLLYGPLLEWYFYFFSGIIFYCPKYSDYFYQPDINIYKFALVLAPG